MVAIVLCASRPTLASAQDSLPAVRPLTVELAPLSLVEGTIDWLQLRPDSATTITGGFLAGEPLHVTGLGPGLYRSLVGVPVDVGDSLPVSLILRSGDRTDTIVKFVRITRAGYPQEEIAVAPAFVRPDSAAAARIQKELARSREVSRRAQKTPRLWRGAFRLPRASRITSRFGSARVFNGEVKSRHLGTDFAGAVGAPVRAAGRGVVALVGDFYLAGKAVYLNHGGGLVTAYFHLSRVDVKEGQTVARGQRIGAVGKTGRVTGPHLHWVARYGAISADPMSLLSLTTDSTSGRGRSTP